MNQILEPEPKENVSITNIPNQHIEHTKRNIYKWQFFIFGFISISLILFLLIRLYSQNQNENLSQKLIGQYSVSTIYANDLTNTQHEVSPFVIGMIKIDDIGLNYPILSSTSDELLEISLCRFAGPMPNEIGNLCIAGHNYINDTLFGRLSELNLNDIVQIYDLDGKMIEYIIFDIYETDANDTSCTNQNTNNNKIVTLLTCNNVNGKRLVVVAKEV